MKQIVLFFGLLFIMFHTQAQTINRVEVDGIIYADANDVEGVTVFNTSSNVGTITNKKGEFKMEVAVNDIIQISALQFKAISIAISEDVVNSKKLRIHLVEQINKLDAVLLSSGLSGNIATDIENVNYLKPILLDMGSMNVDFEYHDDKKFDTKAVEADLKSRTNKGELYNGFDLKKISNLIFGSKDKKYKKPEYFNVEKPVELVDVYSHEYISELFEIPLDDVDSFVAYVETQDLDRELLKRGNEIKCLQFLYEKSQQFLKNEDAKK
ncbi:carboxypeptidase-like regulatory domain-containing protein [Seonamhaeicola sp.]|uniref:carboxypeptidase-like regulatory domain-containing protein n=1 Tax=Seonamhaeicola sp. TaxID=1912245 RepID=UPI00262F037E|nr:carboxypeptidase-like regulatory domain-containing protein [Seonamhaeicola sp.]